MPAFTYTGKHRYTYKLTDLERYHFYSHKEVEDIFTQEGRPFVERGTGYDKADLCEKWVQQDALFRAEQPPPADYASVPGEDGLNPTSKAWDAARKRRPNVMDRLREDTQAGLTIRQADERLKRDQEEKKKAKAQVTLKSKTTTASLKQKTPQTQSKEARNAESDRSDDDVDAIARFDSKTTTSTKALRKRKRNANDNAPVKRKRGKADVAKSSQNTEDLQTTDAENDAGEELKWPTIPEMKKDLKSWNILHKGIHKAEPLRSIWKAAKRERDRKESTESRNGRIDQAGGDSNGFKLTEKAGTAPQKRKRKEDTNSKVSRKRAKADLSKSLEVEENTDGEDESDKEDARMTNADGEIDFDRLPPRKKASPKKKLASQTKENKRNAASKTTVTDTLPLPLQAKQRMDNSKSKERLVSFESEEEIEQPLAGGRTGRAAGKRGQAALPPQPSQPTSKRATRSTVTTAPEEPTQKKAGAIPGPFPPNHVIDNYPPMPPWEYNESTKGFESYREQELIFKWQWNEACKKAKELGMEMPEIPAEPTSEEREREQARWASKPRKRRFDRKGRPTPEAIEAERKYMAEREEKKKEELRKEEVRQALGVGWWD